MLFLRTILGIISNGGVNMKIYLIITAVFIMIMAGCNNDNYTGNSDDEYHFNAKVGQESWEGECYLDFANEDKQNLFLVPYNRQEYIIITIDFNGIGEYAISDSSAVLVETVGGDVLIGEYYSVDNLNNNLKIDNYDDITDVINGTFSFKIRKQLINIDVKSGEFKANFINVE